MNRQQKDANKMAEEVLQYDEISEEEKLTCNMCMYVEFESTLTDDIDCALKEGDINQASFLYETRDEVRENILDLKKEILRNQNDGFDGEMKKALNIKVDIIEDIIKDIKSDINK